MSVFPESASDRRIAVREAKVRDAYPICPHCDQEIGTRVVRLPAPYGDNHMSFPHTIPAEWHATATCVAGDAS